MDFEGDYQKRVVEEFSGVLCVDEAYQDELALLLAVDPATPDGDRLVGYQLVHGRVERKNPKMAKVERYLLEVTVCYHIMIEEGKNYDRGRIGEKENTGTLCGSSYASNGDTDLRARWTAPGAQSRPDANDVMISVIIPVFNSAGSLGRCLEAVAASDYPTYECIVVDDGSTDGSQAVAMEFSARVLELAGGPSGPAYARNRGAEVARGEILFFVDADVVMYPDTLTKVAETFARQPQIDAAFGCYDDSPAVGEFLSQYKNLFHHFVHQQGREEGTTFWSGCGAIRRDVFLAMGGFDEDRYRRPSIEDIELGYRLRAAGHDILLNKDVQVKHLKRWTLRGMIESDVFDRGIPWTRLILQERHVPNDLNLRPSQRVSALLACAMLLHLGSSPFLRNRVAVSFLIWLVAPLLLAVALIMLLNYRFYAFFARKRGAMFALAVVPFHLLYYLYSVLAFVLGVGLHLWSTRRSASPRIRES